VRGVLPSVEAWDRQEEESLEHIEPGTHQRHHSIRARARAAVPIAITFGGFFAGVTAIRISASVLGRGTAPALAELDEILFLLTAVFLGFGGFAFAVKLLGVSVFSKDE
jgi:hypothetical protein